MLLACVGRLLHLPWLLLSRKHAVRVVLGEKRMHERTRTQDVASRYTRPRNTTTAIIKRQAEPLQ